MSLLFCELLTCDQFVEAKFLVINNKTQVNIKLLNNTFANSCSPQIKSRGSCLPPSGRLEKTSRMSPHHVAQYRPTGSETAPPYAPRSSRFGSEPPSVEDDVDVLHHAILDLHAKNNDDDFYLL